MGKSYKDINNKQPKRNNANKHIRSQYENDEALDNIKKYQGTSFLINYNTEDNED